MLRRQIRALLRQYDIQCGPGDCLLASTALALLLPGATVLEGYVYSKGSVMSHAWLRLADGTYVDPTMGQLNEEGPSRFCAPAIGVFTTIEDVVLGCNGHVFVYRCSSV
jgi:hypothetical protein